MKLRLDQALVARGLVRSRNQGREFILAGKVLLNGIVCRRASTAVNPDSRIELDPSAHEHRVGRGYDKLGDFLAAHPVDFQGRHVVDGGASTGGFTQQALERGAASVLCVELGRDQLDDRLRRNPRVECRDGIDICDLRTTAAPCEILMLDLSFTSLRNILPHIKIQLDPEALLIALVKPQFEAEPAMLSGSGRLKRPALAERLLEAVLDCAMDHGWTILARQAVEPGPDQRNREFFFLARRISRLA